MNGMTTIQTFDSLGALRAWRPVLCEPQAHQNFFDSAPWFETLLTFGLPPTVRLQILAAEDAQHGAAALYLLREGTSLRAASSYYSPTFNPIFTRPTDASWFAHALTEWLVREKISALYLQPLALDAPFWQTFVAALRAHDFAVHDYFAFGNWFHPSAGLAYAQYLATRPSRLRNTITRTEGKLAKEPGYVLEIVCSAGPQLDSAIDAYQKIYARSWKPAEAFADFIPQLCRMAAAQNCLRLGVLCLAGVPVAAQLWLVQAGVASIYKLAYDERFAARGVGTALSAALCRYVLDQDKVNEIDFLSGDDAYKREWMSQRRARHGLLAYNTRTLAGRLGAARESVVRLVKNLLSLLRRSHATAA